MFDLECDTDAGVFWGGSIMKMILRLLRHYLLTCCDESYRKVLLSGLFDRSYYLGRYPELKIKKHDLLHHYYVSGWREKRRPSLFFDSPVYRRMYLDRAEHQTDPLLDFLETGWQDGKNPNSYFDTAFYVDRYGREMSGDINPLSHYLKIGWKRDYLPSPLFLEPEYERHYYRQRDRGGIPIVYFLEEEEKRRSTPPAYFDAEWYHDKHPFLSKDERALWHHYMVYGLAEEKSPLPVFDTGYYRQNNRDFNWRVADPFEHYREKEKVDYRRPAAFFDPEYYRAAICRRQKGQKSLLEHYLNIGVYAGAYTEQCVADLAWKPLISIIVPVYNPTPEQLNLCIRSVLYQAYPHWQLCICDDRSTEAHVQEILMRWAGLDDRIQVVWHLSNRGIAEATNTAASLAKGDYLGFLDNDDELSRDCLYHVVKAIADTGADFLYTDEDLVNSAGDRLSVFYKPGYNRELLLGHNYITHFMVMKSQLFALCGGFDAAMDGAQDFDMALKATEKAKLVVHIPEIVYHWRVSESSTNINHDQKRYADDAGKLAVQKAFERSGIDGEILHADWRFYYQPRRKLVAEPVVSVICYPEDEGELTGEQLDRLESIIAGYPAPELLVTSGAGSPELRERYLQVIKGVDCCTYLPHYDIPPKAEQLNRAAAQSAGDFLVFLASDVVPKDSDWIQQLLKYAQDDEVGLVTGRLDYSAGMLDISRVPDTSSDSALYFWWFLTNCSVHMNGLQMSQEVSFVPLELCMIRRDLFVKAGGLAAGRFPHLFMGMDLSLILRSMGLLNIYTPHCRADWNIQPLWEKSEKMEEKWAKEKRNFQKRWRKTLIQGDPYYHPGCYRQEGISDEQFVAWSSGLDKN